MSCGVGNARASRANSGGVLAVAVLRWDGGLRAGQVANTERRDDSGVLWVQQVSVAVVWLTVWVNVGVDTGESNGSEGDDGRAHLDRE